MIQRYAFYLVGHKDKLEAFHNKAKLTHGKFNDLVERHKKGENVSKDEHQKAFNKATFVAAVQVALITIMERMELLGFKSTDEFSSEQKKNLMKKCEQDIKKYFEENRKQQ